MATSAGAGCRSLWGVPLRTTARGTVAISQKAGAWPTLTQLQTKELLHYDRGRRAPERRRPARDPLEGAAPPPAPAAGLRHLPAFEGGACRVVEVPGGVLTTEIVSQLQTFFAPEDQQPVILRGLELLPPAIHKWSLEYLQDQMGDKLRCHAFRSSSHRNSFTYFFNDDFHAGQGSAHESLPETDVTYLPFTDFFERHQRQAKNPDTTEERLYLQQNLMTWDRKGNVATRTDVKTELAWDLQQINRAALDALRQLGQLGWLQQSQLFCSAAGALSPVHYDQVQLLHQQLKGRKRWLLFSPEAAACLYPFPTRHSMDIRSRVNLERPDFERFPRAREALGRGIVADLGPGDLIYLPPNWWHQVQSIDPTNLSLSFWFLEEGRACEVDAVDPEKVMFPLSPAFDLELARQVEGFLADQIGPANLEAFLRWAGSGGEAVDAQKACPGGWIAAAQYTVQRCLQLQGEDRARWLLEKCLDPARWQGLSYKLG